MDITDAKPVETKLSLRGVEMSKSDLSKSLVENAQFVGMQNTPEY